MIKTQGIILRRYDSKEADRTYAAYTSDQGKVYLLAKGAGKIKSKLAGHLEPMSVSSLMIAPGRNANHLAGASLVMDFPAIRSDLGKIALSDYCLEVIDQLTKPEKPDRKVFGLLSEFLACLDASQSERNSLLLVFSFVVNALSLLGYAPELYSCLECKKKIIPGENFFNVSRGGLICPSCHNKGDEFERPIATNGIKMLRLFLAKDLPFLGKIKASGNDFKEVGLVATSFLNYHLDRPIMLNSKFQIKDSRLKIKGAGL